MTNPKPFRLLVVWQLQPLAISSHIWLVAKQWPFNVFSLVFMVLSSKWIIWQMLKLTLAINTFRSLWKDVFSRSNMSNFLFISVQRDFFQNSQESVLNWIIAGCFQLLKGCYFECSWYEKSIDHFPVVCSVTWPLNDSEARGDLVLTKTSLLLFCKSSWAYVNPVFNLHDKSRDVDI